jgi:hypothetical protein
VEAGRELRISLSARLFDNATDTLWRMRLGNGSMPQAPWAFPALVFGLSSVATMLIFIDATIHSW